MCLEMPVEYEDVWSREGNLKKQKLPECVPTIRYFLQGVAHDQRCLTTVGPIVH